VMGMPTALLMPVPPTRGRFIHRASYDACLAVLIAAAAIFSFSAAAIALPAPEKAKGPELILDPRAGSDAVCIMVAVPVGSSCETAETRGASHLVEHMVFDGSERYSREEISGWVDDVGGFLNAFTRKETTVYFLLVPSAQLERGMEVLSQMLLHSIFLPGELEKERKVILEEIRRETDDPHAARERIVDRCLYRGSFLTEPVIGYPSTIGAIDGDDVKAFYRAHYVAGNMRIMLMGGFDVARAKSLIRDYFSAGFDDRGDTSGHTEVAGREPGRFSRSSRDSGCGAPSRPQWSDEIATRSDASHEPGLDVLVPVPAVSASGFSAAILVSRLLESDASPLVSKCKELSLPAPEVSLELYRGFSALRIHVGACEGGTELYRKVPAILESLADWKPARETVVQARVSFVSSELLDQEMYHFYVMSRGEAIALFGDEYRLLCTQGVGRVTEKDCARVLERVFRPLRFNACVIQPETESVAPQTDVGAAFIETISNGCTVAALARPGSPVAALNILIKGRACSEGSAPRGLAEMLMTLFESSGAGEELSKKLEALGARLQYGDNPYVPQDDYLLNPAYAVVRLEAPAEVLEEAASLLVKHLLDCRFTDQDLDEARKGLAREVGIRSGSPYFILRTAMMARLLGGHPYAPTIFPAPRFIMQVSLDELEALRSRYFVGGAILATLVSPEAPAKECEMLGRLFERFPPGSAAECPSLPDSATAASIDTTSKKEGAYLAAGWLVKSSNLQETASLLVAGEILSRRMQLELRERQGLAYSIECGVTPLPGGAVVVAQLGTGAQRLPEAQEALEKEIRLLRERLPDAAEVATARNRLLGKRARSELSSINKAYVLGLDIFLNGAGDFHSMASLIGAVTADDARTAVERSLAWDRAVVLRLAPKAASGR
jgi:zinc protease